MTVNMMLDRGNIDYFSSLYPGDIKTCIDETHIAFGSFVDGTAAAIITIKTESEELYIDWIYTASSFRESGIMTQLLEYVVKNIQRVSDIGILNVLCSGEELTGFFVKRYFEFNDDLSWTNFTAKLSDMKEIKAGGNVTGTTKLKDLSHIELNAVNLELNEAGEAAYGVPLPIVPDGYIDFSCAYLDNKKLKALILLTQEEEDVIDVSYVYKAPGSEVLLMKMLMNLRDELMSSFSGNCVLRAASLNEASEKLFTGLFTKVEKETIRLGYRLIM